MKKGIIKLQNRLISDIHKQVKALPTGVYKCHWCKKFLSEKNKRATIKNPKIFYCKECYPKGLDLEIEAS